MAQRKATIDRLSSLFLNRNAPLIRFLVAHCVKLDWTAREIFA